MRSSTGPHTLRAQKLYSSGPETEATGTRDVARAGASRPSSDRPWSGLSPEPTWSSQRPSHPVRSFAFMAPTSQKWREAKCD
jgi:hypothetical protein